MKRAWMPWCLIVGGLAISGLCAATGLAQSLPPSVSPELLQQAQERIKALEQSDPARAKEAQGLLQSVSPAPSAPIPPQSPDHPAAAPPAASPSSDLERFFSDAPPGAITAEPEGASLTQFGYDLFRETTASFTPVADTPVSPDYVIGPGDEFTVIL